MLQHEAGLTADRGILRYTGLITISATTIEDLDAHVPPSNKLPSNPTAKTDSSPGSKPRPSPRSPTALSPSVTTRKGGVIRGTVTRQKGWPTGSA